MSVWYSWLNGGRIADGRGNWKRGFIFVTGGDVGKQQHPECEPEREQGKLQERGEAVNDAHQRNPDAPRCDERGDRMVHVIRGGENAGHSLERVVLVLP